jgi:hypothetical protein
MKKKTWRRISVLGVVLMAASAVTAAILPNTSNSAILVDQDGSLTAAGTAEGNPVASCTATTNIDNDFRCNITAGTATTTSPSGSVVESTVGLSHVQTANNTTD